MHISEISPFIRQAVVAKMSKYNYISYPLKTKDHRLFYILGGEGRIVINGVPEKIEAGLLVILRSGTEYIWQITSLRYLSVNFDITMNNSHLTHSFNVHRSESVGELLEPGVSFDDTELFSRPAVFRNATGYEALIAALVAEFSTGGEYSRELTSSMMKTVLISAARDLLGGGRESSSLVRDVISFIQNNYHKPIRNTDIAKALHFNPTYMNREFKARTGNTIRAFLIDYRINSAIELIYSERLSVSELALAVGFSDVPHFIKTFKSHTGKTPTEYRSSARER